jgi:hypothetical protein
MPLGPRGFLPDCIGAERDATPSLSELALASLTLLASLFDCGQRTANGSARSRLPSHLEQSERLFTLEQRWAKRAPQNNTSRYLFQSGACA